MGQKCIRNRFRSECFRGTCRIVTPGSVTDWRMRHVLCHVLLIFARRGHTNTMSTMEYSALFCTPAPPSPCPLVLAPPPSQSPPPQAHRPLRHVLLQLQSCKMNSIRNAKKRALSLTAAMIHKAHLQRTIPPRPRYPSYPNLTPTRTSLPGMVQKTLKTQKTGRFCTDGASP